ncbi:MAG: hypothetical protein JSS83_10085 [Cyanobacteria bacterium SZAS LIN-3]|nr:hypothetical protein [Cyanobacteria bacterium SZAS LIN-3]
MYKKSAKILMAVGLAALATLPSFAYRGGFGGARMGGYGGFSHAGYGGFNHASYGGFNHAGYGGFDHAGYGGFGGHATTPAFGGGFNGAAGEHPMMTNHPNYGAGGFDHGYTNHAQLPTDGGFGNLSGARVPANGVHNSFNGDGNEFNRNVNVNNVNNVNAYRGYGGYGGYHPYGAYGGYHPYGGYGYHPYYGGYGYGYNPTAMMWTYAGISSLTSLTSFLGMSAIMGASGGNKQPASYSNVTYNGGNVYVDGQQAGSSADFYKQAQQLAATAYSQGYTQGAANGATAADGANGQGYPAAGASNGAMQAPAGAPAGGDQGGPWQALGTFSLSPPGQTQSQTGMMVQLEINKDGVLHGTYYNQLTMETSQIYGALDKKTQRVSWTIGTNPSTVFDAGLGDLVKEESSVLVHYSADNTQRMALVRLKQPPAGMQEPGQGQGQGQPMPSNQPG